jgi:ketosteroid isomerase-like protein
MSKQKEFLRRVAAAITANDVDHIEEWFTEDFALHDPAIDSCWRGHDGARRMLQTLKEVVPEARLDVLDMVEEGDRVAVRWLFTGVKAGEPVHMSVIAIYRFKEGRIAEDWGAGTKAMWP